MISHVDKALEYRSKGCNCAQAVACAFLDVLDVSEKELMAITQALGTGIGGSLLGTCGAVSGATIVLGLLNKDEQSRAKSMREANFLITSFNEKVSSTTCGKIKGIDSGVVLKSCNDCIVEAVKILDEIIACEELR